MIKKRGILIIMVVALGVFLFLLKSGVVSLPANLDLDEIRKSTDTALQEIKKEIANPPPLRAGSESQQSFLIQAGTIKWTNIQRADNGGLLPPVGNAQIN